jgi:hypothetical protein
VTRFTIGHVFFLLYGFESDMRKDWVWGEREEVVMRDLKLVVDAMKQRKID